MQRQYAEAALIAIEASRHCRNLAALISPIPWLPVTRELLDLLGEASKAEFVLAMHACSHLSQQRPREAAEISDALRQPNAVILYFGQRYSGTRKHEIVLQEPGGMIIFLGLKFLTTEIDGRPVDQCIASTAYKIGAAELRRRVRLGRLRVLPRTVQRESSISPHEQDGACAADT